MIKISNTTGASHCASKNQEKYIQYNSFKKHKISDNLGGERLVNYLTNLSITQITVPPVDE